LAFCAGAAEEAGADFDESDLGAVEFWLAARAEARIREKMEMPSTDRFGLGMGNTP
jgi:hypothetical protein